jgi:hypothetical protein
MYGISDPEFKLSLVPTLMTIGYAPIREEDLISRRITVKCKPVDGM